MEKKVSISLAVNESNVLLSYLIAVYFSFLVFLTSNYYSRIFSGYPSTVLSSVVLELSAGLVASIFFFGILVS